MVMVETDSNHVLVQPMKNKSDEHMVDAYEALLKRLQRAGIVLQKHFLNNRCSVNLKEIICNTCKLELVPPGCHQRNIAEVATETFKQHFLSILAGLPDGFPLSLWDRLLSRAILGLSIPCVPSDPWSHLTRFWHSLAVRALQAFQPC